MATESRETAMSPAGHFNGRFYHNGDNWRLNFFSHWWKVLQSLPGVERWEHAAESLPKAGGFSPVDPAHLGPAECCFCLAGHASLFLQVRGLNLLVDPVWSRSIGPLALGLRRKVPPAFLLKDVPRVDGILITHDHFDHLDQKTVDYFVHRDNPRILAGLGMQKSLSGLFRRGRQRALTELDWWDRAVLGDFEICFVPAEHFSGRGVTYNRALWGGFVIHHPGLTIYCAGDTAYSARLLELKACFPRIDLSFLPIGAYQPSRHLSRLHLSPHSAVRLHKELGSLRSVAIHFGSFQMSQESGKTQVRDFRQARDLGNLGADEFLLPVFGKTYLHASR